jgi:hypothetical protein
MGSQQPQHPLAAHPHAMLATQPGAELAVALAGKRRILKHPAEQPDQLIVADRGRRPGRLRCPSAKRRA